MQHACSGYCLLLIMLHSVAHSTLSVRYPDKGLKDNFCRNPDGRQRPWCFTTNPDTPWEYCDVKQCGECDCQCVWVYPDCLWVCVGKSRRPKKRTLPNLQLPLPAVPHSFGTLTGMLFVANREEEGLSIKKPASSSITLPHSCCSLESPSVCFSSSARCCIASSEWEPCVLDCFVNAASTQQTWDTCVSNTHRHALRHFHTRFFTQCCNRLQSLVVSVPWLFLLLLLFLSDDILMTGEAMKPYIRLSFGFHFIKKT